EVSGRAGAEASVGTAHSWLRYSSASRSGRATATTAIRPSGETVGTPGVRRSARSFGRMPSDATRPLSGRPAPSGAGSGLLLAPGHRPLAGRHPLAVAHH